MRLSSVILSSAAGLAAVCSGAAIRRTPPQPQLVPRAVPFFKYDVPQSTEVTMDEDGDAQSQESNEPAAVIPGSYEQFVVLGGNSWCTGSLVGPRLVATARHCVKPDGVYTFSPAYYAGNRFPQVSVTHVLHIDGKKKNGTCGYSDDWAIFVIDRDLSATNGYLGVKAFTEDMLEKEMWWSYGYPQDRNRTGQLPFVNHNFKIWRPKGCDPEHSPLLHSADSSPGQSGSAIWLEPDSQGRRYQYGVHVASSKNNGIMSTGPAWLNAIVAARKSYP
ncbi:hypothetical protein MAPG_06094 [Magnaporthiopsis poae ATCC 64411]|uniref:Serine protease n=1 Tax=Magnaporthiopsis poae (strain ATCC 64411 / 73-15) TaxID=644358 RepID=A0A0C4E146_MAGP6|nr:hypothetical protein MAPG_06094 [Magnaporthiopsis poae ATCC 64411]